MRIRPARLSLLIVFLTGIVFVASCTQNDTEQEAKSAWERVRSSELTEEQTALFRRAEKARGDLAGTLMSRVTRAMSQGGPAEAIEVCNLEAQGLTQEVAEKHGVKIGRTSFRLRNPENGPPEWARKFQLVQNRVEEQVLLRRGSNQLAVFSPIRLGEKCAACHGSKDRISDAVKKELAERYPNDEATGFKPGDLRGWFWVEVPNT